MKGYIITEEILEMFVDRILGIQKNKMLNEMLFNIKFSLLLTSVFTLSKNFYWMGM